MPLRTINQTAFVRGVNAMSALLGQPRGSVQAASNMWMARRGALMTIHGTDVVASPAGGVNAQAIYDAIACPWFASATSDPALSGNLGGVLLAEITGTPETTAICEIKSAYTVFASLPTTPVRAGGTLVLAPQAGTGILPYSIPNGAAGGTMGSLGPLPQLVNFGNVIIIAGGNTYAPQSMGLSYVPTALANNFVNAYPVWVAATYYPAGSQIVPTTGNGHFYVAQQAGTSGATQPTWPTATGAVVKDVPASAASGIIWKESGPTALPAPRGAAHAISHGSCLFLWNTAPTASADGLDGPEVLAQSDVNNPNSWNPVFRATIGKGDGQTGTGMSSFTISEAGIAPSLWLICFKEFSTYAMQGLLPNAMITRVETDLGCVAPRSIQFVPNFGVCRLTHQGFAVTDGIVDRIFSDPIRPYLFPNQDAVIRGVNSADQLTWALAHSFQTKNPVMYCCTLPTTSTTWPLPTSATLQFNRLACFDVELSSWTIIDLPFNVYGTSRIETAHGFVRDYPCLGGQTDGKLRHWQGGDKTWDTGSSIAWSVTLPEVFSDGSGRMYFQDILCRGTTLDTAVTVSAQLYANSQAGPVLPTQSYTFATPGDFELRIPVTQTALSMHVVLSGSGRVAIESVKWSVAPLEARVPASLMTSYPVLPASGF